MHTCADFLNQILGGVNEPFSYSLPQKSHLEISPGIVIHHQFQGRFLFNSFYNRMPFSLSAQASLTEPCLIEAHNSLGEPCTLSITYVNKHLQIDYITQNLVQEE